LYRVPFAFPLSLSLKRDAGSVDGTLLRERNARNVSKIAREGRNESRESAELLFPLPLVIVDAYSSRGVQGVIIFPALVLMAGLSASRPPFSSSSLPAPSWKILALSGRKKM